jgi:hypothetical protein
MEQRKFLLRIALRLKKSLGGNRALGFEHEYEEVFTGGKGRNRGSALFLPVRIKHCSSGEGCILIFPKQPGRPA